jgi:LCP family protein required for cell wall assembly
MKKKHSFNDVGTFFILLVLILVIIYSGLQILESSVLYSEGEPAETTATKTIIRNGVEYYPRQDITVVMVLGIDRFGPVVSSNYYRNDGSADSVMLVVCDETNKTYSVLYLNRDTMVNMDVLGVRGEYAGTAYGQLALAHTYGTGLEDSSLNVKKTLTNFIHGMTIDYYLTMHMDAIPVLNDAVGGVTVNVKDDFSQVNPSITMGELTLRGDQVLDFVRTRKDVGDQKNVTRMERQREYVDGFLKKLMSKEQENLKFAMKLYENVSPYIVTDCSAETLSGMLDRYVDFTLAEVVSPEGETAIVNGHYEFYADEEKLDELIIRLFYAPKK